MRSVGFGRPFQRSAVPSSNAASNALLFWTINHRTWLKQPCPTPEDQPSETWWTRYAMWLCPKCFALLFSSWCSTAGHFIIRLQWVLQHCGLYSSARGLGESMTNLKRKPAHGGSKCNSTEPQLNQNLLMGKGAPLEQNTLIIQAASSH